MRARLPQILGTLLIFLARHSLSSDLRELGLSLVYSTDRGVCAAVADTLRDDRACRNADAVRCSAAETLAITRRESQVRVIEQLASNIGGYTEVARSTTSNLKNSQVLYLGKFQGDRHERLLGAWKVRTIDLKEALDLPFEPLAGEAWAYLISAQAPNTKSMDFAPLLAHGEKLSDEWSPVIEVRGASYMVLRECSGLWAYGGFYACKRVTKLTVTRLSDEQMAKPVCQFTRIKKK